MGPTNIALVNYYRADQRVREAQSRLDAATKDVRVQERRVNDLAEKQKLATSKLRKAQSRQGQLDLDLKSRDAHIEKLRTQQQNAKNNKEYQAFLVEINTEKVDRAKVEEELLKLMEQVEKQQADSKESGRRCSTAKKPSSNQCDGQITDKIQAMQAEIDALKPERTPPPPPCPPRRERHLTSSPTTGKAKPSAPWPSLIAAAKNTCAPHATWIRWSIFTTSFIVATI